MPGCVFVARLLVSTMRLCYSRMACNFSNSEVRFYSITKTQSLLFYGRTCIGYNNTCVWSTAYYVLVVLALCIRDLPSLSCSFFGHFLLRGIENREGNQKSRVNVRYRNGIATVADFPRNEATATTIWNRHLLGNQAFRGNHGVAVSVTDDAVGLHDELLMSITFCCIVFTCSRQVTPFHSAVVSVMPK